MYSYQINRILTQKITYISKTNDHINTKSNTQPSNMLDVIFRF